MICMIYLKISKKRSKLINFNLEEKITWHFIPPYAPHFGGLWEAAVKSAESSLYRVTGGASLRYDELQTQLVQVEAILNSRPLYSLSEDPNDLQPLTPSHFLIGAPLTFFPEPSLDNSAFSCLSRWQRVEKMRQDFWSRWLKEYLHTLQHRTKWRKNNTTANEGQLVILKQANTPVLSWPLGRIESINPGNDGIIRAVKIRTNKGSYSRPVTEICVLPIKES